MEPELFELLKKAQRELELVHEQDEKDCREYPDKINKTLRDALHREYRKLKQQLARTLASAEKYWLQVERRAEILTIFCPQCSHPSWYHKDLGAYQEHLGCFHGYPPKYCGCLVLKSKIETQTS